MKTLAFVGLPPAPSAVFVLEIGQPFEPGLQLGREDFLVHIGRTFSSFSAWDTITLGRKLDMVCSVQP